MPQNLRALEHARELDALGLNVLPAIPKGKKPAVAWEQFQTKRSTPQLAAWFGGAKAYNFWIVCGAISGVVVLDCDTETAVAEWQAKLNGSMSKTTCVKTAKGYHWWFKLDGAFESWDGPGFNVRGDGTGVIAPPSVVVSEAAPNGHPYTWVRGWDQLEMVPEALRKARVTQKTKKRVGARTGLTDLLSGQPDAPEKGNSWMTQVAGHYAKWIPFQDAFEATIRQINANLQDPIAEEDLQKLMESIWTTEREKLPAPTENSGWLRGTGTSLLTQVRRGEEEVWAEWGNFDIKCLGVIINGNEDRFYSVEIETVDRPSGRDLFGPDILGSLPKMQVRLAAHGVSVVPPPGDPRKGSVPARLQRYLESQDPPILRAVPCLGFQEGYGFIVHEGVITEHGLVPHSGVIPDPKLREWAPYRYGSETSQEEARAVLNEVLTFQEEELCSVFGAWWAACFLKGQPDFGTSLWPYIALEAPSESGKTRGFFSLMIALTGNTEGHGESTTAALRDKVSAHRNGPVWIDDLSDVVAVSEILRQATSEGTKTKKGQDRTSQESVKLIAPIVLSGESMGAVLQEKAQWDRAIRLSATSPKNRMSFRGEHWQWDDIQDLLRRYEGDLTRLAGWMAQMALAQAPQIALFRELRGPAGRHNDKIGVLRVGARVLSGMTGDERHTRIVDEWCARQEDLDQENVLTKSYLPMLLTGLIPTSPKGGPPVFVHLDSIYFSVERVAEELKRRLKPGERATLASIDSLHAQRQSMGILETKRLSVLDSRSRGQTDQLVRYWRISAAPMVARILERAGTSYGEQTFGDKDEE